MHPNILTRFFRDYPYTKHPRKRDSFFIVQCTCYIMPRNCPFTIRDIAHTELDIPSGRIFAAASNRSDTTLYARVSWYSKSEFLYFRVNASPHMLCTKFFVISE